jgi:protein gp37
VADRTKIEWCDATFNPWVGCTKVSAGCTNCYAERDMDIRRGFVKWGKGQPRRRTSPANWKLPLKWDRDFEHANAISKRHEHPLKYPRRPRVFCASLADVFDEGVSDAWRDDLFALIQRTTNLDWLLLTKRPERAKVYIEGGCTACFAQGSIPVDGGGAACGACLEVKNGHGGIMREPIGHLPHVWLGVSVEDQDTANKRIPILLQTPAAVRWVSYEPALGSVDFTRFLKPTLVSRDGERLQHPDPRVPDIGGTWEFGLDWIVVGGESGPKARPFDLAWARSTIEQCRAAGVSAFCKQLGRWPLIEAATGSGPEVLRRQSAIDAEWPAGTHFGNPTGQPALNGRVALLHDRKGADPAEWPADLRVREWPAHPALASTMNEDLHR